VRDTYKEDKGASLKSYMAKVLRHRLQDILDEQLSNKRKSDHLAVFLDEHLNEEGMSLKESISVNSDALQMDISLRIDLEKALSRLTPVQRRLCELLRQGYSVKEIAEILNKPRATIYEEMKRIREVFANEGLEEYLD
jgi:RNA polymerase sigma-70 factor (ECF subfamily)